MSSVAAIVITYNRPLNVLVRALNSVLNQSRQADEIIVVYTGGNKKQQEIIEKYICSLNHNIRLLFTETPASGAKGRNLGAHSTKCDYLSFLDDDDEWSPEKLISQMSLTNNSASLIASPYIIVEKDGTSKIFSRADRSAEPYSILGENIVGSTSFPLISRVAFNSTGGFDETFCSNQEWELWIRIILGGGELISCNECAGIKHEMTESITSDVTKRMVGYFTLIRKHWKNMIKYPEYGAEATTHWWMEAYRFHRPLETLFALSISTLLRILSVCKKRATL